jgi:hypothetical protein
MSSRSSVQAMNFWPRPMVYLPLATPSKTSRSSSEMHCARRQHWLSFHDRSGAHATGKVHLHSEDADVGGARAGGHGGRFTERVVVEVEEEGGEVVLLASCQVDHCFIPRGPSNDRAYNAWGDNEFLLYPGPHTPVPLRLPSCHHQRFFHASVLCFRRALSRASTPLVQRCTHLNLCVKPIHA